MPNDTDGETPVSTEPPPAHESRETVPASSASSSAAASTVPSGDPYTRPGGDSSPLAVGAGVADGRERKLSPQSVSVARIASLVGIGLIGGVSLIGMIISFFTAPLPGAVKILMPGGWVVIHAGLAGFAIWWPTVRYRYTSYRIDSIGFTILRGVIFRSIHSIPSSRIQHTDVSQGPLERAYGLATLIVHTAGTENASISLSGLTHDDALGIRDHLIEVGGDDAV